MRARSGRASSTSAPIATGDCGFPRRSLSPVMDLRAGGLCGRDVLRGSGDRAPPALP
jgi:hypothetical protein